MKAKTPLVLATGILSGVTLSLVCVSVALLWEGRSLRHQLASTTLESVRLRMQQENAEGDLTAQRAQLDALAAEVEQLRQFATAPGAGEAATRQARRARVYVGDRVVGLGWVWASPQGTNEEILR
jgi:cell division protein FtsB